MVHGIKAEHKAVAAFAKQTGKKVDKCGIFVSTEQHYAFLAASPDGLVGEDEIVEVKAPYSALGKTLKTARLPYLTNDNGNLRLKRSHRYYDQVMGQLLLTKRRICNFVVFNGPDDMVVDRVAFDADYCEGCLIPKLRLFWEMHHRPFLCSKFGKARQQME